MHASVRNFLYRNPGLYELVYPEPDERTPNMCLRMMSRYLPKPPGSVLDVGCGTGRDLDVLSRSCPDVRGVDYLPEMVAYASAKRPHLPIEVGDMRTVRLGRTFDVVMSLGSALMYALTNDDVARTLDTLAAHAHAGTLLILDINNAAGFLGSGAMAQSVETTVSTAGFSVTAVTEHRFDRRRQLLIRRRTWQIAGRGRVADYCEYRLFFPAELENLLAGRGFEVVGLFDNMQLNHSDLSGPRLYTAAKAGT